MRDHQRLPGLHAGAAADLDASIRWLLLAHDDLDAGIASDVANLHVVVPVKTLNPPDLELPFVVPTGFEPVSPP